MNRLKMITLLLGLTGLASIAEAGYPTRYYYQSSYCAPTYSSYGYAPSYCAATYSGWTYRVYPGTQYYYRVRNRIENGCYYPEQDVYLFVYANGCYTQHCLISEYLAKPALVLTPTCDLPYAGKTTAAYDVQTYLAAKLNPKYANLLQQQGVPSPVDIASLLPPSSTLSPAIFESNVKQQSSAAQAYKDLAMAEIAKEKALNDGKIELAKQVNTFQAFERSIGKFSEMAVVTTNQTTVNANATASQIPLSDPLLVNAIAQNCFNCHGGNKVEKGLDFRQANNWDDKVWRKVSAMVACGQMPPPGNAQPLDESTIVLFERQYLAVKSKAPSGF